MEMVLYLERLPGYSLDKQIDRINNDGDYAPGNLRWATAKSQADNKSNSIIVTYMGETMNLKEFLRRFYRGVESSGRVKYARGMTLEQLAAYKPNDGRFIGQSRRKNILWVEYGGETIHFKTFVRVHTKLSYVQANKLRLRGWTLEQLAKHIPRKGRVRSDQRGTSP